MANNTRVEWCDATLNYVWGCSNGCSYCAAKKMATRFGRSIGKARGYSDELCEKMARFEPVFLQSELVAIHKLTKPSRIFHCLMSDLFGNDVPEEARIQGLHLCERYPQHTHIFLTKQPQNLEKYEFPDNAWVGTSVTGLLDFCHADIHMQKVKAKTKFLSFEPLLSPMGEYLDGSDMMLYDWIIIGARTQPLKLPNRDWVLQIEDAADEVGIPIFEKDSLAVLFPRRPVRREFPK